MTDHPLALANVGLSLNASRETGSLQYEEWREMKECFERIVGVRGFDYRVTSSMMLLVERTSEGPRQLLYLMALLEGPTQPEDLVKFFYKHILTTDHFDSEFAYQVAYLKNRSLIEVWIEQNVSATAHTTRPRRKTLAAHPLRTEDLRRLYSFDELDSLGAQIVKAASECQGLSEPIQGFEEEVTLIWIMAMLHFAEKFLHVVGPRLRERVSLINNGVIPERLQKVFLRSRSSGNQFASFYWLLSPDGEGDWWQLAHASAKKVNWMLQH